MYICTCTLYMYCTCTIVHVHRINSILDLLVYCIMCSICILYIYTYLYGNRGAEILKVNFYFPPSAPNLCFYAVHRQAVYIYIYCMYNVHRPIPYLQLVCVKYIHRLKVFIILQLVYIYILYYIQYTVVTL